MMTKEIIWMFLLAPLLGLAQNSSVSLSDAAQNLRHADVEQRRLASREIITLLPDRQWSLDKTLAEALLDALDDSDTEVRKVVSATLVSASMVNQDSANTLYSEIPRLLTKLRDPDSKVRRNIVKLVGLVAMTQRPIFLGLEEKLRPLIKDPDQRVRLMAIDSLSLQFVNSDAFQEDLVRVLTQDKSGSVRLGAARAIGQLRGTANVSAIAALIQSLDDPSVGVRHSAVGALLKIGPSAYSAIPHLEKIVGKTKESDPLHQTAAHALRKIQDVQ